MEHKKKYPLDEEQLIVILTAIQKSPQHPLYEIIREKEKLFNQSTTPITDLLDWLKKMLDEHPEYLQ